MSSRQSICTAIGTTNRDGTLHEESKSEHHMNDYELISVGPSTDSPPAEQIPQVKKRKASTKAKQGGKTAHKKYRGIRGKLEGMNEMPLDIWHEIFMELHPIDLVHLSRTSKALRRHLMSRSSITVWKAARASVIPPMPECPDDFSEPAYADLAFGKACHYCLKKTGVINRVWYARRRICNNCLPDKCRRFCNTPPSVQILFGNMNINDFLPSVKIDMAPKYSRRRNEHIFLFIEYFALWEKLANSMATVDERSLWLERKQTAARQHSDLCEAWEAEYLDYKTDLAFQLVESRRTMIAERVIALGWSEEAGKMQYPNVRFQYRRDIDKMCRKELTEQMITKLEPSINEYMEEVKHQRLEKERKGLLTERLILLKKAYTHFTSSVPILNTDLIATAAEMYMEPCIRDIIGNLPKNKSLTKGDLLGKLAAIFHDANERVRRRIDNELLKHAINAYKTAGGDFINPTTVFNLATTLFQCNSIFCSQYYWYDAIVAHKCTRSNAFPKSLKDADIIADCLGPDKHRSHENITVDVDGIVIARHLIRLCGLDPLDMTRTTMDNINPIFECLLCNDAANGRATMTWSRAVRHWLENHRLSVKIEVIADTMVLVNYDEANVARARIAEQESRKWAREIGCNLVCAHCGQGSDDGRRSLVNHVLAERGVNPILFRDLVPDPSKDHTPALFYMWPPRSEVPREPVDKTNAFTSFWPC
ncbi:hypothetical protein HYPSUDRAFT_62657 [Hypholoma sublateritium FD-334 SS-4]|uniref:F-box domain-containing protein n=1 Tax=Hypholoma sublateritium (strain FD-334 SS-4) TaxID=945553 RepID=A0A0D2P9I0_HYPSF|nr:hypothetical protein HYPSUDRAFT_62657 [Hypholoma sublateritium FD-334 SS-4]